MAKEIIQITQIDEGGENPKTKLFEDKLWELTFIDHDKRIIGKSKMEEYISKAYEKTCKIFERKYFTTTSGKQYYMWGIVFVDYSFSILSTSQLCERLKTGYERRDEEKLKDIYSTSSTPENPAIKFPTTPESEKKELEDGRKHPDYTSSDQEIIQNII